VALLDELAAMIQHEKQLREQIAAAIASKQLLELAPLVEQLHALRPDDAAAHKLAENLRRQMVLRAQQYAANARDTLAWRALQAIPSFVVDEPTQALRDEIEERVALREAIAEAPYATASLAGLVRRLAKLCPQDPAMPQWRKKLSERMEKAPEDPHLPAARWAAAKGDGRLGLPVEAWAYFARPQVVQEEAQRRLRQHPGQFFTALGLALEALGVTPLACELSPPREGLLARLPGLGRRGARAAWAVDLGSTAIKALRATQDGSSIRIDAVLRLPVPERAAENVEAYEEALREVAKLVAQSPALVCVGLPGRWLLGRFFEMPAMKGPAWEQALRHEAQHQLPLALEELCWHAVVVAELPATPEGPALRRVVLQAARRGQVEQLLAVCRAAGLSVARVQSEPLALHHAVQWELAKAGPSQSSAPTLSEAVWVVDWGATQTHIIHSHCDRLVFRTLSLGTDDWAKRLGAAFGQRELAECRTLLMDPAKAPVYSKWQQAGMLAWEGLTGQVQRCLASFLHAQETQPRQLIGLGGGFQMHGVVAYLRRPAG
jgi:Tfp pilus assembly PilM family ATPase